MLATSIGWNERQYEIEEKIAKKPPNETIKAEYIVFNELLNNADRVPFPFFFTVILRD